VVDFDIVQQMSLSSTEYPDGVNEFLKSGLTMLPSELVKPFRVQESPVQFECKINDIISLGTEGGAGNLIICEVIKMHISEQILDENQMIDQAKIDLVSRMGGNWYSRANMGLFEIPKPLVTLGIGVDRIPENIRKNPIFNGNDLGMLGNVESLPNQEEITIFVSENLELQSLLNPENQDIKFLKAKEALNQQDAVTAWKILLS
jgi:hypothetical protein